METGSSRGTTETDAETIISIVPTGLQSNLVSLSQR